MIKFILNDSLVQTDLPSGSTLLDYVRYQQQLYGTKIGCREGDCGACTVLVGKLAAKPATLSNISPASLDDVSVKYTSATSCLMPLANCHGKHIVTVEGINLQEGLSPVQHAIVEESATQCGFCTVGFVLSLTGFMLTATKADTTEAIASIDGNICRCTGYKSLQRAAVRIAQTLDDFGATKLDAEARLALLVEQKALPAYFTTIAGRLKKLAKQEQDEQRGRNLAQDNKEHAKGHGVSELKIAGGTDLLVQRPLEIAETHVNAIGSFSSADPISIHSPIHSPDGVHCVLSGATTVEEMRASSILQASFPNLDLFIKLVSSTPIRHMATIGGNLVNASPIGDISVFLLAMDSELSLQKGNAIRKVALKDFFLDYKKIDLQIGEIVASIKFKLPANQPAGSTEHFNFEKVCKRTHLDIATVNSAMFVRAEKGVIQTAAISAGGVGPIPMFLTQASEMMAGMQINTENLLRVGDTIQEEISPISDVRGSAAYKRLLLRQFFYAHFITAFGNKIETSKLLAAL